MGDRKVCCCRAGGSARAIGWLQIILNIFAFGTALMALVVVFHASPDEFHETYYRPLLIGTGVLAYAIAIIVLSLTLIVSGVAIVMGFVLIKASNERKTRYLRWWIIYAIICIIWGIFATIINDGENIAIAVVRCVLLLCLYSFGIWVVRVHIQEIDGYRVTSPY